MTQVASTVQFSGLDALTPNKMKHAPTENPLLRSFTPVLFGVREIINRHRKITDGQFKSI